MARRPRRPRRAASSASSGIAFIAAIVGAVVAIFRRRRGQDLDEDEWQELPPPAGG